MPIKINMACGGKIFPQLEGWVNVDFPGGNYSNKKPDVEADVFDKLPFPDDYADEVHGIHILEHAYAWQAVPVLYEWKRILKPGGLLVLELPCLDKIIYWFLHDGVNTAKTHWGIHGDPSHRDPKMCHKWSYTKGMMRSLLEGVGFAKIEEKPVQFHVPKRDMRFECIKP